MKSVYGRTIYSGKKVLKDSYLVYDGTKVVGVSSRPKGNVVGKYKVITPALVEPHAHIGIHRSGEPLRESESNDGMDAILALPDVLDSVQMDDAAFTGAVEMGVLTVCVVPGSRNMISGKSAILRTYGSTSTHALIGRAGMKAALGYNPIAAYEHKGRRASTRMGSLAILRERFDQVERKSLEYKRADARQKKRMSFSKEERVLQAILAGKEMLRVHAHKVDDIAALLRLVDEYNLKVSVEHAMNVDSVEIFKELKKRKITVTYGPVDTSASKVELAKKHWRNIKCLIDSGVSYCLMTDHPVTPIWNLLMQTRWFLRAGISRQEAMELVTRRNAEFLGIQDKLGSLEKGKWASFVCWNGDPFSLTNYPVLVCGEGKVLYEE